MRLAAANWVTLCTHDEGMLSLASVPADTAVPMTEVGHSLDSGDAHTGGGWFD